MDDAGIDTPHAVTSRAQSAQHSTDREHLAPLRQSQRMLRDERLSRDYARGLALPPLPLPHSLTPLSCASSQVLSRTSTDSPFPVSLHSASIHQRAHHTTNEPSKPAKTRTQTHHTALRARATHRHPPPHLHPSPHPLSQTTLLAPGPHIARDRTRLHGCAHSAVRAGVAGGVGADWECGDVEEAGRVHTAAPLALACGRAGTFLVTGLAASAGGGVGADQLALLTGVVGAVVAGLAALREQHGSRGRRVIRWASVGS